MSKTLISGVDVSHHQGGIVWKNVAASGRKFAYCKATESTVMHDDHFVNYRVGAMAAGLHVGGYHFYRYAADWAQQAHSFVGVLGTLHPGELPPAMDLEDRDGILKLALADATRQTLAWLEAVEAHCKIRPVIYADRDFVSHYLKDKAFSKYPLWLAAYSKTPPACPKPWSHITFWQNDEHGVCPGVYGDCDLDYFMGTEVELKAMCVQPVAAKTVPAVPVPKA